MPRRSSTASRPARVLGLEPDAVTRALISLYLEPHGYDVQVAPSIEEALAALDSGGAVAFLCSEDALRGVGEGQRRRLRAAVGGLPVVALAEPGAAPGSTQGWPSVRERLTKPVRGEALLGLLAGTRPAAAPAPGGAEHPAQADAEPVLAGFRRLIAEMEMDRAMVEELTASFLERAPAYLEQIGAALAGGALEQVDRVAHTLKGMCGNLRFGALVERSDDLRRAAKAGDAAGAGRTLEALRAELGRVERALRALERTGE